MYKDCLLSSQALVQDSSLTHRLGALLVLLLLVVTVVPSVWFVLIVEEEKAFPVFSISDYEVIG